MADQGEYNPDLPHTGEDRAHAIPIPVVSADEAVHRQLSGDSSPVMLDTQTIRKPGPVEPTEEAPAERKGWAVSNDEANAIVGGTKPLLPPGNKVEQGSPGWLDYTAAAARESNLAGAAYDRFVNHPDSSAPDVPGYNPYDSNNIAGYEDYASKFANSNSPQQTQVIKERIDQERQDQKIISQAGAAGWATSAFFGITDPTTLALMFVPGLGEGAAVGRLARFGRGAAGAVVAGEVQQAALTRLKTTTDYTDNMLPRLASDALLGGTLGALLRARVPKAEFDDLAAKADRAVNGTKEPTTEFFHSSPHVFDEFDASRLGTGEGNQSFGVGKAYVATNEGVAGHYANIAESKGLPNNLYRGELKTSDVNKMLDMDKPLKDQPHILEALGVDPNAPKKLNGVDPEWTGSELYDNMRQGRTNLGVTDKTGFSDLLEGKGVTGIKYLDAQSRAAGEGSANMVIFKNTEANLTHRNGEAINTQPSVPTESTGGAAAVRGTTLEDESFAKGGAWLAKADSKLPNFLRSPSMRIMSSSPVVESRRLVQRIVDLGGGMLNKNKQGIATPTSVEMVANQMVNSREAQIFRGIDDLRAEHVKEAGENALNKHDFGAEILKALSNGDKHEIPQIVKAAKIVRPFFDADHQMLQKIAPDADYEMLHKTAESYAPRVWDINKITADRTNFEEFLHQHFSTNPKTVPVPEATVKVQPKALGEGNAQTFIDDFHAAHPEPADIGRSGKRVGNANVDLSKDPTDPNRIHIDMVTADKPGSALSGLRNLIRRADRHGVTLQTDVVPVGKGGPSEANLIKLYEHAGFRLAPEAPGAVRTTMVREGLNDRVADIKAKRTVIEGREYVSPEAQAEKAEEIKKLDQKGESLKKIHEASQPEETAKTAVGPPKPIFREPAEIKSAVQDTIDNIQHAVRGTADVGTGVRNPKSAQARKLDVTDDAARPWLSDDFEGTIKAYMRTMVPHIEMHRQFGSVTLEKELQQISDSYRVKMAAGSDDAAKAKLVKQREADIQDLTLMRDRTLGQAGPRNNESLGVVRAAQITRSVNYVRSLGAQLFSAIPDLGRVVARYGMANTVQRTAQFALSSELRNMAKADAQRMGTALDVVLHTREHSLEGTGGMMPTGDRLNQMAQNATAAFTKYSLIAHWDSSIRLISAQLEQDALARMVQKPEGVSAFERAKLAAHGIGDDELAAIREQWNTHGSNEGGLNRARTELWTDKDAAANVEQAVQRAASTNAFFIGKGDVPGFADTQTGKFMFQFKGFVMSSVERLALPLAQGIAHGDVKAANGLAMMLSLGGLRYYLKERAAGRQPDMSPASLGPEMLAGSGVLTFLPDMYDPLAAITHLPRFSKFKDHGWEETAFGPTAGMLPILGKLISDTTGGKMTAQDAHKVRQLLPYQNMFYANRLFNLVEGKFSDAFNLKNAQHKPALDYLNPAKDTAPIEPEADKTHLFGINAIPNKM